MPGANMVTVVVPDPVMDVGTEGGRGAGGQGGGVEGDGVVEAVLGRNGEGEVETLLQDRGRGPERRRSR